jgi:hypothetical protein
MFRRRKCGSDAYMSNEARRMCRRCGSAADRQRNRVLVLVVSPNAGCAIAMTSWARTLARPTLLSVSDQRTCRCTRTLEGTRSGWCGSRWA